MQSLLSTTHVANTRVRLSQGLHRRNASVGVWATAKNDDVFEGNCIMGDPLQIDMRDGGSRRKLYAVDTHEAVPSYLQTVGDLLRGFDATIDLGTTEITFYPVVRVDHGLFCRATPSFRNEERFDFIEYLCRDTDDKEYSRYGQLMAIGEAVDHHSANVIQFVVVRPFEEVKQITLPRNASAIIRVRIQNARKRATGAMYNTHDGTRLGRPYLADDPYCVGTTLVALDSVLAAVHLIQDFNSPSEIAYYVADSTTYYR